MPCSSSEDLAGMGSSCWWETKVWRGSAAGGIGNLGAPDRMRRVITYVRARANMEDSTAPRRVLAGDLRRGFITRK